MPAQYRSKTFTDISLDMTPHPLTGDLVLIRDANAIKRSMRNIIDTVVGERPYSLLGSNIRNQLFEFLDYGTASEIQTKVEYAIKEYEPRVKLDEVTVEPDYDRNEFRVTVQATIKGTDVKLTLDQYLKELRIG
jgi:phage baseplate assembly protein W